MHSFHDEETGINILHNGDYSGDAIITLPTLVGSLSYCGSYYEITLPCKILVEFSEAAVVTKIVSMIESADYDKT